jgi:hypothetical protein
MRLPGLFRNGAFCFARRRPLFIRQHAADRFNCLIDPARYLAGRRLQTAGACGRMIEFARKARAVGAERMDLGDERILAAVDFVPPLGSRFERVKCMRQPLACRLDGIAIAHWPSSAATSAAHHTRKPCDRKRLRMEAYVASSFSVNVQSDFSAALCMTLPAVRPRN